MEFLQSIDASFFQLINENLSNSFFDLVVPWFREKLFWLPLYVFLVVLTVAIYKKHAYVIILTAVFTLVLSDQLSSSVLKPTFKRERPCNNEMLQETIHVLAPCRNSYSFTSSHAFNHFAVAAFFICLLGPLSRLFKLLWIWAGMVCFAQVYVGLHYPFDVIVGGFLGALLGISMYEILKHFYLNPLNLQFS